MSNLFSTIKHLLSRSLAWALPYSGFLYKYLEGLSEEPQEIKDFSDNVYLDIFPQTTREPELWEQQFNLTGAGTEQQRRDNIAARWLAQGGQGKDYLEDVIHAAGFTNVFIHEWWTETSPGVYVTKNPNLYLQGATGFYLNQFGRTRSQFGRTKSQFNGIISAGILYLNQFGRTRSQFGRTKSQFNGAFSNLGGTLLVNKGPDVSYVLPQSLDGFREMIYVGSETFPDFVYILISQQDEFERLILRYFPYSKWIGELINFILGIELWTAVVDSTFSTSNIQNITSLISSDRFVAVGNGGKMAYSGDEGITWTAVVDSKITGTIQGVIFAEALAKVVAVGNYTAINDHGSYSDDDGETWTAIADLDMGTEDANEVAFSEGLTKFVAVGDNNKGSYSSDGENWTAIADMKFGANNIMGIASAESASQVNKFVAVGQNDSGSYSPDGENWTAVGDMKFGGSNIQDATFSEDLGIWVAVGNGGKGSWSPDGENWTAIGDTKFSGTIRGVTYALCSNVFLAVGNGGVASYSEDGGLTWTLVDDSTFGGDIVRAGNGLERCVIVGNNGKMAYSFNGVN